jgi:predicted nucleic acid-binding protein
MMYLLDSNTLSELYDTGALCHSAVAQHLCALTDQDQVYISILSLYELEYGWANAPDDKKNAIRQMITEAQADFGVHPLSASGATVFGDLKGRIKEVRSPSKENMKKFNVNLMLAATSITTQCRLVSADRIFQELQQYQSSLKIEDWTT